MRVLALQANNAAAHHFDALTAMITRNGDTLVNWGEYDALVLIPGEHNGSEMESMWNETSSTIRKFYMFNDREIYLDMGFTKMLRATCKPAYLLCGTADPIRSIDGDYWSSDAYGPVFTPVEADDLIETGSDPKTRFAKVSYDEYALYFYEHMKEHSERSCDKPFVPAYHTTYVSSSSRMLLLLRKS